MKIKTRRTSPHSFTALGILLFSLASCQMPEQTAPAHTPPLHVLGMDAKFVGGPIMPMTWQNEATGKTQTVRVMQIGDKIVYQGEVIGRAENNDDKLHPQAAIVTTRKWLNNTIPYTINATANTRNEILKAVNYYNANTNLRWIPRTNQTDYVEFFNESGCWSYVGRYGGKQEISLDSDGCGLGATLHEMGHTLGFHHEQSRPDRDTYVRVRLDLIPSNDRFNWDIEPESQGYGNYDYYSIMHYGLTYNGQKVIEILGTGINEKLVGNGQALTATDIGAVNFLYPAVANPPIPPSTKTFNGSLVRTGRSNYHDSQTGFYFAGGTLKATLTGPSNADFDLYLQKLNAGAWVTVAFSDGSTSNETVKYTATAATYRWQIFSYRGSGTYTLAVQ